MLRQLIDFCPWQNWCRNGNGTESGNEGHYKPPGEGLVEAEAEAGPHALGRCCTGLVSLVMSV